MKHKYHTDEKYKEYQKQNVLRRYYKDREKDKLFFKPLTNLNEGIQTNTSRLINNIIFFKEGKGTIKIQPIGLYVFQLLHRI